MTKQTKSIRQSENDHKTIATWNTQNDYMIKTLTIRKLMHHSATNTNYMEWTNQPRFFSGKRKGKSPSGPWKKTRERRRLKMIMFYSFISEFYLIVRTTFFLQLTFPIYYWSLDEIPLRFCLILILYYYS